MSKSKSWRSAEEIVAMIEKALSPHAIVEHDVMLPVVTGGGEYKRQCDVVIRMGPRHRQTLTIVEVQKRRKKVGPADFGGWLEKMKEVGANELLCVSEAGFTEQVIRKVQGEIGLHKVRLLTLTNGGQDLSGVDGIRIRLPETYNKREWSFDLIGFGVIRLYDSMDSRRVSFRLNDKVLSTSGRPCDAISVTEMVKEQLSYDSNQLETVLESEDLSEPVCIILQSQDGILYFHSKDDVIRLKTFPVVIKFRLKISKQPLENKTWNYTQKFHDGNLAFASTSSFINATKEIQISLVAVRDEVGRLRLSAKLEHQEFDVQIKKTD